MFRVTLRTSKKFKNKRGGRLVFDNVCRRLKPFYRILNDRSTRTVSKWFVWIPTTGAAPKRCVTPRNVPGQAEKATGVPPEGFGRVSPFVYVYQVMRPSAAERVEKGKASAPPKLVFRGRNKHGTLKENRNSFDPKCSVSKINGAIAQRHDSRMLARTD